MNFKKGLTRIFIVGIFLVPFAGLVKEGESITKTQMIMWDTKSRMVANLAEPACSAIVSLNPKVFPEMKPSYACSPLSIYWQTVKEYQSKNGLVGVISAEVIEKAMDEDIDARGSKMRWEIMGLYLFGYLVLCLVGAVVFFIGRWIFRGFKSQ